MDTNVCILCILAVIVVVVLWSNNENYQPQPQYYPMGSWSEEELTLVPGLSDPLTIQEIALRSTTTPNNSNFLIITANNTPSQPERFGMKTYF